MSVNSLGSAIYIPRGGDRGGLDCPKRRNGRAGLPAPAERFVEANQRLRLDLLGRDVLLLEVELLPLSVQYVQVVGQAVFITGGGELGGQMGGGQRAIEVVQTFLLRSVGNRRVVDLLHRGQDRLLVGGQSFARRQIRDLDLSVERPEIEEGPVNARPD